MRLETVGTLIVFTLLVQADQPQQGRFEKGFYSTCPATREIRGVQDMFAPVSEKDLLRLANSRPIAKCPLKNCSRESVSVDITVHEGDVFCATAKSGSMELQKAAVEAAMLMKFKKMDSTPFFGITGIVKYRFE